MRLLKRKKGEKDKGWMKSREERRKEEARRP